MELTIEITNYCENNCPFCSSDAIPQGVHLSFEKIKQFIDNYDSVERINISGGEPLAHPDFYKILMYCYVRTQNVHLLTNKIRNIDYNAYVLPEGVKVTANVPVVPGVALKIPKSDFEIHLLKFVPQGRGKNIKPEKTISSGNTNNPEKCATCNQPTLKADGKIVPSPCRKDSP